MPGLAERFVTMAIIYAVIGMSLGIAMGAIQDFTDLHVHAHLNVVGWATMALFGLIYRAWPALAERKLAVAHFWAAMVGVPILLLGMFIAKRTGDEAVVMVGASIVLLSMILFLVNFLSGRSRTA
jgi:cbb3-type cytochrome oxidase subunit 1